MYCCFLREKREDRRREPGTLRTTCRLIVIPDEAKFVENVCKVHFTQSTITSFVSWGSLLSSHCGATGLTRRCSRFRTSR